MATRPAFFSGIFTDNSSGASVVAAGYLLDAFDSGTTTPKQTFSDEAGLVPNANPIVLDASGRCSLFFGTGQYTLRLRTPGGAVVYTWDDVEGLPTAVATQFLPLSGGTMTGAIVLQANATANLHPVTKQQFDAGQSAQDAATTTAINNAVAGILPAQATHGGKVLATNGTVASWQHRQYAFTLVASNGAQKSRVVRLVPGTYDISLQSTVITRDDAIGSGSYSLTATHTAQVLGTPNSTVLTASLEFVHGGSSGYGRTIYATDFDTASLVVATEGDFTMQINNVALNGAQECKGAVLHIERVA